MLEQLFNDIGKHTRNAVLLLIAVVFTATSAVAALSTNVNAAEIVGSSIGAATTYTWTDRQTISVTGGSVKSGQSLKVDANANSPTSGNGSILMTEKLTIRDCWLFICNDSESSADCFVTMSITIASGLKQGTLKAVIVPSAGNSGGPVACTQKSYDAYNGKVVSIGGTRPGSTDTTVETDIQKTVFFVVKSNFSNSDAPESVNIKITGVSSKILTATKSELYGNVTFRVTTTLEPGAYNASVENPPEGLVVDTVGFMKSKFTQLTVNIGDAEGFADRQIEALVKVTTQDPSARTYGPLDLTLYGADNAVVNSGVTNSVPKEAVTEGSLTERIVDLYGILDGVDPGTYKLCVGPGESLCQEVVKEDGKRKQVAFETTGDQLLALQTTTSSCNIDGIGWIVCPVFIFLANISDATYGIVERFLETNVKIFDTQSGTYTAWQLMRNIANVGFVIIFLIIIFSQLSGAGIGNYGVKKMLPRLVVAAILVNLSFFVSQLAVDISNILGGSLKTAMDNLPVFSVALNSASFSSGAFSEVTSKILGGAFVLTAGATVALVAAYAGIGLLIPILLSAVVAIVMTLAILVARQALIILLVAISPLAFLAMILPNTEKLFKQWQKIFVSLLLIYPAVALLFGGARVASGVLLQSMADGLGQLVALAVMVLPLFLLPSILKGSLNAIPAIGNLAQKLSNNATAGTKKWTGKGMDYLGQRSAASNTKFGAGASNAIHGRGMFGRRRQAAAKRSYVEPRMKDIMDQWASTPGAMEDDKLLEKARAKPGSFESQAAIAIMAREGNDKALSKLRQSITDPKEVASYNNAIEPYYAALKAKDIRTVFPPNQLRDTYNNMSQEDVAAMKPDARQWAIEASGGGGSAFSITLAKAMNNPQLTSRFTPKEHDRTAKDYEKIPKIAIPTPPIPTPPIQPSTADTAGPIPPSATTTSDNTVAPPPGGPSLRGGETTQDNGFIVPRKPNP